MKSKYQIAPEYPRIPHLSKISNMANDDIINDDVIFPLDVYVSEKVDGANSGISWNDGPILRNKNFVLNKGYSKIKTPAKIQFKSAWNWLHNHENDIKEVQNRWDGDITIYGEWLLACHSLHYNKLPDLF